MIEQRSLGVMATFSCVTQYALEQLPSNCFVVHFSQVGVRCLCQHLRHLLLTYHVLVHLHSGNNALLDLDPWVRNGRNKTGEYESKLSLVDIYTWCKFSIGALLSSTSLLGSVMFLGNLSSISYWQPFIPFTQKYPMIEWIKCALRSFPNSSWFLNTCCNHVFSVCSFVCVALC